MEGMLASPPWGDALCGHSIRPDSPAVRADRNQSVKIGPEDRSVADVESSEHIPMRVAERVLESSGNDRDGG